MISADDGCLSWQRAKTVLNCKLGWLRVARFAFQTAQVNTHFSQAPPWQGRPMIGWDDLPAEVQLLLHGCWPVEQALPRISRTGDTLVYVPTQYKHYYVDLQGTYQEYQARFSGSRRRGDRHDLRRLEKHLGGLDLRVYQDPSQLDEFIGMARQVYDRSYKQQTRGMEVSLTPAYVGHLRELCQAGGFLGYALLHAGSPVAINTVHISGAVGTGELTAYDAAYRDYSPGRCLLMLVLEHLFKAQPFGLLDMGHAEMEYKKMAATHSQQCADIYCFRRNMTNLAAIRVHHLCDSLTGLAGTCLAKLQVKDRLKRWRRRRADLKSARQSQRVAETPAAGAPAAKENASAPQQARQPVEQAHV